MFANLAMYRLIEFGLKGHETWLHWNMWLGTFEFWIDQRMITINANQMKKTEMKR